MYEECSACRHKQLEEKWLSQLIVIAIVAGARRDNAGGQKAGPIHNIARERMKKRGLVEVNVQTMHVSVPAHAILKQQHESLRFAVQSSVVIQRHPRL